MFFLILAIVQSTLILVLFKLFTRYKINNLHAIVVNYLVASLLGFYISTGFLGISTMASERWLPLAIICGFFLMFVFIVFAQSSQKVGVAITAVTSKMSVVIPVMLGFILYNEPFGILKFIGITAAMAAFFFIFKRKEKITIKSYYLLLPLLLFMGNGINDSLLNYAEKRYLADDTLYFLSAAFFVSLFFGIMTLSIKSIFNPQKIMLKSVLGGILLGLLNLGSTLFFLLALGYFESSVFFPIFNVSIVASAALIGFFIFKEPLKKANWVGIALAAISIIVLTLV